jgi:DNA-binding transcriptional MerR regulator
VRISELADRVGVPTSTVRYYERIGLLSGPPRTASGYREYDRTDAARLLFVVRARRMGLSCDQVSSLLGIWAGTHCANAAERVGQLIDEKQAEIVERIAELHDFATQLDAVRNALRTASSGAQRVACVGAAGRVSDRPHLLRAGVARARRARLGALSTLTVSS